MAASGLPPAPRGRRSASAARLPRRAATILPGLDIPAFVAWSVNDHHWFRPAVAASSTSRYRLSAMLICAFIYRRWPMAGCLWYAGACRQQAAAVTIFRRVRNPRRPLSYSSFFRPICTWSRFATVAPLAVDIPAKWLVTQPAAVVERGLTIWQHHACRKCLFRIIAAHPGRYRR